MKATNSTTLQQLKSRLLKIESELSTCRTSVLQDGWQTQRHAKKARKWDILAQRKMEILSQIDEIEYSQSLMDTDPFV
jgi:allantoicase